VDQINSSFYKKTVHIEDYLLGGRKTGRWVTALTAQASDMSG
jgi:sodium/proline symporter